MSGRLHTTGVCGCFDVEGGGDEGEGGNRDGGAGSLEVEGQDKTASQGPIEDEADARDVPGISECCVSAVLFDSDFVGRSHGLSTTDPLLAVSAVVGVLLGALLTVSKYSTALFSLLDSSDSISSGKGGF